MNISLDKYIWNTFLNDATNMLSDTFLDDATGLDLKSGQVPVILKF